MRFKLVPKKIKEEDFWRNYFYRVSLIKQSVALHSMSNDDETTAAVEATVTDASVDQTSDGGDVKATTTTEESMAELGDGTDAQDEEDIPEWEKELQRELQEYEVSKSDALSNFRSNV